MYSSVYSCPVFLISSASVMSVSFLSLSSPSLHEMFPWNLFHSAKVANWRLEIQQNLMKDGGRHQMAKIQIHRSKIGREEARQIQLAQTFRKFLYSFSMYSCHLFLISSASVRSIPFLSFIVPIFA